MRACFLVGAVALLFLLPISVTAETGENLILQLHQEEVDQIRLEIWNKNKQAIFDSGLVRGKRLEMDSSELDLKLVEELRYELRAWDARGELILSQVSKLSGGLGAGEIFSLAFETVPAGTQFLGGEPITLDGDVTVTGILDAVAIDTGQLRDASGGPFFGSCPAGSSIRSINPNGSVACENIIGGGDNLGNHQATQNISFTPQLGLTATGGAKLATGGLGGTWFAQAGNSARYRFGARAFDAVGDQDADFVIDENGFVGVFRFNPLFPLDVLGNGRFGNDADSVQIGNDAINANIELRGVGTPYIDFSNEHSSDFDMRLLLSSDNSLTFDGGRLGIGGTMTSPQYKVDLPNNPNPDGQGRANAWLTYSSERFSRDIQDIPNALGKIVQLRGVEFAWDMAEAEGSGRGLGFIAEEVATVLPDLVDWEENGRDAKAMNYSGVIPVLVEAMKEQQTMIEALRARLAELEAGR